ncbi:hypothetical protein ACFLR1_06130, partial [Bacteroidota bacterium]
QFTTHSKRTGFPCGNYTINVPRHDDYLHILVNGTAVWQHNAAHGGPENNIWTGGLGSTDSIEIRHADGGGGADYAIDFVENTLTAGTLSTNRPALCASGGNQNHNDFTATFSVAGHAGTVEQFEYQWDGTGGTWQTDWTNTTATTKTFANDGTNTGNVLYVRARVGFTPSAGCPAVADVYTNTVQVNVYKPSSGDAWGNNEWIAHAYNYSNINLQNYAGFYTQKGLSYNSGDRWGTGLSPAYAVDVTDGNGTSLGYKGCEPGGENHAMASKRTNFGACALYRLDGAWDDRARLYINGIQLYEELADNGNSVSNLWTGMLGPNDSIEFRHREVTTYSYQALTLTPITLTAGTLTTNQTIPCFGITTTFSVSGHTGYVEQFEYKWDNGAWQTDWTNTTATTKTWYNDGVDNGILYVRARIGVKQEGHCTAPADVYTNTVQVTPMNTSSGDVYGDNEWIAHAYWNSALDIPAANYNGYYTQRGLSYNTTSRWNATLSPAYATQVINGTDTSDAYIGCNPGNDWHALSSKRKGFGPCAFYRIDVQHDDHFSLYVNGVLEKQVLTYGNTVGAWYGELDENDSLEVRHREFGVDPGTPTTSYQATTFTVVPLSGTLSASVAQPCIGQISTLSVSPLVGYVEQFEYRWDGAGAWQTDWTNTTSTTYDWTNQGGYAGTVLHVRARIGSGPNGSGTCTTDFYTNTVQITPKTGFQPIAYGNGYWISYAYQTNDFNLLTTEYRGSYTDTTLSLNSSTRWATGGSPSDAVAAHGGLSLGYTGCTVGVDNHAISSKRTNIGSGCELYKIDIGHDDGGELWKNGVKVWSTGGPGNSVWYTEIEPSDSLDFRTLEGGGGSLHQLTFTKTTITPGTLTASTPNARNGLCFGSTATFTVTGHVGNVEKFEYQWGDTLPGEWQTDWTHTGNSRQWAAPGYPADSIVQFKLFVRARIGSSSGDNCSTDQYTNTVVIYPSSYSNSGSDFGVREWIIHAYWDPTIWVTPGKHAGFYTQRTLSFDSNNRWATDHGPYEAADVANGLGYQGCNVGWDNFGVVAKRTDFRTDTDTCDFYRLDVFHDDEAILYVNNNVLWQYSNWGNKPNIWKGELGRNDSVEFRVAEHSDWFSTTFGIPSAARQIMNFVPINLYPGVVHASDTTVCQGETTWFTVVGDTGFVEAFEYRWNQQSSWTLDTTYVIDSDNLTVPATFSFTNQQVNPGDTLKVRARIGTLGPCIPDIYTPERAIYVLPINHRHQYGENEWIAHAYEDYANNYRQYDLAENPLFAGGTTGLRDSIDIPYWGFYFEPGDVNNGSYSTLTRWNEQTEGPYFASGYKGCDPTNPNGSTDNFILISKRKGFPCGYYDLRVTKHDDFLYVMVNGDSIFYDGFASGETGHVVHDILWSGYLGPNDSIEIRTNEGLNWANQVVSLQKTDMVVGVLSASELDACTGGSSELTWANGWFESPTNELTHGLFEHIEAQWSGTGVWDTSWVDTTNYTWVEDSTHAGQSLLLRARVGGPSDCYIYTPTVQIDVVADPTPPTSVVRNPGFLSVCSGDTVAVLNPLGGSEGLTGCSVEYQFLRNNTVIQNWSSTPFYVTQPIDGDSVINVVARRNNCTGNGCETASAPSAVL